MNYKYLSILEILFFLGVTCLVIVACQSDNNENPTDTVQATDTTADTSPVDITADTQTDVDVVCGSCHGTTGLPVPPPDLLGQTDRSAMGVGAHEAHLRDSDFRGQVKCQHCHVVPETIDADGHMDDQRPADVVFSGLAINLIESSRDGDTCSVYCHGGANKFEPKISPSWTSTTGTACTTCHGFPPAEPHTSQTNCVRCHGDVIDDSGVIISASRHVDSILQGPHGAHIVHLGGAGGENMECTDCHVGLNYHGPLVDGNMLAETTLCNDCHDPGINESWHDYTP